MVVAEDKFKKMIPYELKRAGKIIGTSDEAAMIVKEDLEDHYFVPAEKYYRKY